MITVLIYFIFNAAGEKARFQVESEFKADGVSAINYQDRLDQEFLIKKDFRYYLTNQKNISQFQINIPDSSSSFLRCLELDGQPPHELLFQCWTRDTLRVLIYHGSELAMKLPLIKIQDVCPPAGWDGGIVNIQATDLNADGAVDLIFAVAACFDLQPRGLIAYDLKNRRSLWHFWMGAFPRNLHLADVNEDGIKEIIVTTTAVSNGSAVNGYSDSLAYAICLNADGGVMWQRVIGGQFIDAVSWLGDWHGNGHAELVIVPAEGSAVNHDTRRIMIINAQNGEMIRYINGADIFLGMVVCDLDRDERCELVTGSASGDIRVYDRNLNLVQARQFDKRLDLLDAGDLDGDGSLELILREPENRLVVLDDNLQLIGEYRPNTGERISVSLIHHRAIAKILALTGEAPPFNYSLLTFSRPFFFQRRLNTTGNIWFWITLAFIIAFLPIHIFVLRWHRNLKKKNLYTNQLLEWSGLAQRLAHEIKNPLSTINLTLQRLHEVSQNKFGEQAQILDRYTTSILEEVNRLRDTTDKFMKIMSHDKPRLSQENINEVLEEAVQPFEASRPEGIRIEKHLAADLPLINCDRNQVKSLFMIIIENALEAMTGQGVLILRSSLVERVTNRQVNRLIEIRFEDTGVGISSEGLKRIFKNVHTTKKSGNGIGLLIAKRVVDTHNGHIDIVSREGLGTVVTIQLPVEGIIHE